MHVVTVVGARPQFVKAAVLSRALRATEGIREVLVHTGQHYDAGMSDRFFEELGIPHPDHHLGVGSGRHGSQTGAMLERLEVVLLDERPDWVLVYGDTNSTVAGALAAAKLDVPVAHVEAGLRSFDRRMPEEVNRVVADHVARLLFAPTQVAARNLGMEGIGAERVRLVGDVMYDAALHYGAEAERSSRILERLEVHAGDYVLATVHRASNTDDANRLATLLDALRRVAVDMAVVLPLHPRTRAAIYESGAGDAALKGIRVTEPLGYLDMTMLERGAAVVATDSGGVQKEAFFHRVPCVTLREATEWTELVELGWNRLAPPSAEADDIAAAIRSAVGSRGVEAAPYGDGRAAERICEALLNTSPTWPS